MGIIQKLNSFASYKDSDVYQPGRFNPGLFRANKKKIKALKPQLFRIRWSHHRLDTWQVIHTQLNDGDIQPAVVVSVNPMLVACYTDELDAVAIQCYPQALGEKLGWKVGTRLLATALYNPPLMKAHKDLDRGPGDRGKYKAFGPVLADLFTDDAERLARKKGEIPKELWERTMALGHQYLVDHPGMARNGLGFQFQEAIPLEKMKFDRKIRLD